MTPKTATASSVMINGRCWVLFFMLRKVTEIRLARFTFRCALSHIREAGRLWVNQHTARGLDAGVRTIQERSGIYAHEEHQCQQRQRQRELAKIQIRKL